MKKMDTALHLRGEVWQRFREFYRKRNNVLHGTFPAQRIDTDGVVSIAAPAGECVSEEDWLDESLFSESDQKRFVYAADFIQETLQQLLKEVNAASSRFLTELTSQMPGYICAAPFKLYYGKFSALDRVPTNGSPSAYDSEFTTASGCRVVRPVKR
jgi:hypothetical protein